MIHTFLYILAGLGLVGLSPGLAGASGFPLQYESCGATFELAKAPQRAISIDVNTTEIMLELGLEGRLIAAAGLVGKGEPLAEFEEALAKLPQISANYPSLEVLVGRNPDFVFAGWQYGFSESSGVTPERLARLGIGSYALQESCIRIAERPEVSLDDTFYDIRTIARIFGQEKKAEELIAGYQKKLATLANKQNKGHRPRVFLFDSGEQSPFTAGGLAMPTPMISLAGGFNVFSDVKSSWTNVNWEEVIARDPEFIIIAEYGAVSGEDKWQFLKRRLAPHNLTAIKNDSYMVLSYAELTPGVRNVDSILAIASRLEGLTGLKDTN